jgi:hypothetical protein
MLPILTKKRQQLDGVISKPLCVELLLFVVASILHEPLSKRRSGHG